MLRLVDVIELETDHVTFQTQEVNVSNLVPYIVYDTSTGVSNIRDYVGWRSLTITSTGYNGSWFSIDNTNLYPKYSESLADYSNLDPLLLKIMTFPEYNILIQSLSRIDLVRRRLPNPGHTLSSTNAVGENGVVSFSGGYEKKFTLDEMRQWIEGSIIEINWSSPSTSFWPGFMSQDAEVQYNPYLRDEGIPFDMIDIIVQGVVLRALNSWGLMEIDLSFSINDSGLSITYDRGPQVKGWHDTLFQNYVQQKSQFKMNYANHAGVGLGTFPWGAGFIFGTAFNNVQVGGALSMSSVLGWTATGARQL